MLYKSNRDETKSVYAEQIKSALGNGKTGWHGFLMNGLSYQLPKDISPVPETGDYIVAAQGDLPVAVVKKVDFESEYGVRA